MTLPMQDFLTQVSYDCSPFHWRLKIRFPKPQPFYKQQFTDLGATTSRILRTDGANPAVYAVFPGANSGGPDITRSIITTMSSRPSR